MLQHVSLEVRRDQIEDCVAFWALLGFERMTPPPLLRDRFTWVQHNGTQIHLMPFDDPVTTVRGHAAVVVEDYEGTLARLRAAGHPVRPRKEHWGAPRAFVTAPGGHRVEVMAAAPAGRRSAPGR
jgi:catechol 2,3-dioxygenase-like lactoylglutathione lyase family enzyme